MRKLISRREAHEKHTLMLQRKLDYHLIESMDRDGNGVDRIEFIVGTLIHLGAELGGEKLHWAQINPLLEQFDAFDVDGDARLTAKDMKLFTEARMECCCSNTFSASQAGGHYMSSPGKVPAGATVATLKPGAGGVPPKLTSKRAARVWPDGTSYEGEWREGRATGRGRTKWVDGSSYDGAHADGRPHGEGTCTYSDGGWYEGGWARGLRHGDGVMGYADGSRWEGQWMEGRRHGRGVRVAPSGERHEEEWSHGERQLWAPPKPKGYAAEPPQRKVRISVTTGQTAADGGVDDAARGV